MSTDSYGIQGQAIPAAATLTDLVSVAAATQAVISTVVVCNESAADTTYRISVAKAAAADDPKQYLAYDAPLKAKETFGYTLGITLNAGDVLRCYSSNGQVAFNAFGSTIA